MASESSSDRIFSINGTEPMQMRIPRHTSTNSDVSNSGFTEPMFEHRDSMERIDVHSAQQIIRSMSSSKTPKSGRNVLEFEDGNAEDPWADLHHDSRSVMNKDYTPPCPWLSSRVPYCCIVMCCCCWSTYDRQQCSLALLYTKFYLAIYVLSILITVGLLCYDLSNGSIGSSELDKEPIWFISLDIFCVGLMVFDIAISILAVADFKKYFKKLFNVFDFLIVVLCVVSIPIYWVAPDWILSVVLLLRFIVRMLRIITVIRHQKERKEYNEARDTIVDFTKFNEQNHVNEAAANNRSEQFL